jgi:hypothetical protein
VDQTGPVDVEEPGSANGDVGEITVASTEAELDGIAAKVVLRLDEVGGGEAI